MSGDERLLNQAEIEELFGAAGGKGQSTKVANDAIRPADHSGSNVISGSRATSPGASPFVASELDADEGLVNAESDLSLIADVDLDVRIELGRTRMCLENVLKLREGSIISLDKLAGDPVDVYVNGQLLARGEILVLDDNFCVRISEILGQPSSTSRP